MTYDDDRPGMMRVHIAQRRSDAITKAFTRDHLRLMCRARGLSVSGHKTDLGYRLAFTGLIAPGYDKATER